MQHTVKLDGVITELVARKARKGDMTVEEWIERLVTKECVRGYITGGNKNG